MTPAERKLLMEAVRFQTTRSKSGDKVSWTCRCPGFSGGTCKHVAVLAPKLGG